MASPESKYKDSLVTQELLDSLMKEAESLGPEAFDGPDDGADVIDQSEIDALLGLVGDNNTEIAKEEELVTQDDIDALFSAKPSRKKEAAAEPDSSVADSGDSSDLDFVSMEDIEALMRSDISEDPDDELSQIRPEDISALLQAEENDMSGSGSREVPDEDGDTLISQDDIDALLSGGLKGDRPKEAEPVDALSDGAMEEEFTISQDDIDKLLAGTDSGGDVPGIEKTQVMSKEEETDSNLISQSDIDKLLMGSVEEKQEPETLIDQEDIDRLLSSTDVLKMEAEKSSQPSKLISQDDIDRLLNEDTHEKSTQTDDRVLDQVIIEKSPDEPEIPAADTPAEPGKALKWNKKKMMIGAVAAVLVAIVAGAGGFWALGRKHATHEPVVAVVPEKPVVIDTHGETPAVPESGTHSLTLKDFVVLSPDSVKGVAYISFDLSVEIVDVPSNQVKDSEQMFRNVIYEAVSKAFVLHGETNIAEEDVIKEIKDALNAVLPHGSVSKIDMNDFKLG